MPWISIAALLGALGVAAGAFGAHGLKDRVDADGLAIWKTAAEYQMYHALALLLVGVFALRHPQGLLQGAAWCFFAGTLVFSGSLYTLVLSGVKWLGAITPIGGTLHIVGWLLLAVAAWKARQG